MNHTRKLAALSALVMCLSPFSIWANDEIPQSEPSVQEEDAAPSRHFHIHRIEEFRSDPELPTKKEAGSPKSGFVQSEKGMTYIKLDGTPAANEIIGHNGFLYAFDSDGILAEGWIEIDGKQYYAGSANNHALLTSTTWQGHAFDEQGVLITEDWVKTGQGWQYRKPDGTLVKDEWYTAQDGRTYYFDTQGLMKTGWQTIQDQTFYLKNTGELAVDTYIKGRWYVDAKGVYQPEAWEQHQERWALKKGTGQYARNEFWQAENGNTYWFDADGWMRTGWAVLDGKDYYFVSSGEMAKNRWVSGKWYLGADGAWIRDHWQKLDDGRYAWVYGDGTRVEEGRKVIDGQDYYFDEQGLMHTGWKEIDGYCYYYSDEGPMVKKAMIDDEWYANSLGIAYTGYDIEIAQYCDGVYERNGLDLYKNFCWVVNSMRYVVLPIPLKIQGGRTELQNYGRYAMALKGNCYCYAALFWYLADGLGCHPEYVQGRVLYSSGVWGYHGWVVMYENGQKYYYDAEGSYENHRYFFRKKRSELYWIVDR